MKAVGFDSSTNELNIQSDSEAWRFSSLLKHLPEEISPPKLIPSMEADITLMGNQFHINSLPDGMKSESFETLEDIYSKDGMALLPAKMVPTLSINVSKTPARPLRIAVTRSGNEQSATMASLQLNIKSQVKCSILQEMSGDDQGISIGKVKVNIEEEAALDHAIVIKDGADALHVGTFEYTLAKSSQLNQTVLALGAKMARIQLGVRLLGENAHAHVSSLNALDGKSQVDFHSLIRHESPRSYSTQKAKNFLAGESKGIFTGKIFIAKDAQQVEAQQMNRNLLLSKKAHALGQPQLEINADDVKCAHGSSTGQIEEEATFYLESRGITPKRAQEMLALGFVQEVFGNCQDPILKKALETAFHGRV